MVKRDIFKMLSLMLLLVAFCGNLSAQSLDTTYLDYETYLKRVMDYSRDILKSEQEKIAVKEAVKFAKTNYLPRVDLQGSAQYRINDSEMELMGAKLNLAPENYSVNAQLSQILYNGGGIRASVQSAMIQDTIATSGEELTLLNVKYAADVNFWSTVAKKDLYNMISEYVEIVKSLVEVLKIKFENGEIAKTDYLQTCARLKEAQISKSDAYKSYKLALQNFNIMMGVSPNEVIIPDDSIYRLLPVLPEYSVDRALQQRPDYRIAELQQAYQNKQLRVVQSNFNPQLSIGLQQGWGTQMINLSGETVFTTNAFASLKVPIFAWGARYKRVNQQKALIESANLERQKVLDNVVKELSAAWTEYQEYTKQIEIALESTVIAEENLDINTFSYNEGRLTILDVLQAQLSWIQSKTQYITALLQQKVSRAAYIKATADK